MENEYGFGNRSKCQQSDWIIRFYAYCKDIDKINVGDYISCINDENGFVSSFTINNSNTVFPIWVSSKAFSLILHTIRNSKSKLCSILKVHGIDKTQELNIEIELSIPSLTTKVLPTIPLDEITTAIHIKDGFRYEFCSREFPKHLYCEVDMCCNPQIYDLDGKLITNKWL